MFNKNFVKIVSNTDGLIHLRTTYYKYLLDSKVPLLSAAGGLVGIVVVDAFKYYYFPDEWWMNIIYALVLIQFLASFILLIFKDKRTLVINKDNETVELIHKISFFRKRKMYDFKNIEKIGLEEKESNSKVLPYKEYVLILISENREIPLISFNNEEQAEEIMNRIAGYIVDKGY